MAASWPGCQVIDGVIKYPLDRFQQIVRLLVGKDLYLDIADFFRINFVVAESETSHG